MSKKIIALIVSSFLVLSMTSVNVNAYQISAKKEQVITTSLSPELVQKIDSIVAKWDGEKTYQVYKKIKKLVLKLQAKTLKRTDLTEAKKLEYINKFNAVLYIIEKHVPEQYAPTNQAWDSI